ncbi:MGH1-like glycoside hydrolase domain-containing protein [Cohnella fermenti]|uniref:Mannosylglycerate hydrolase MGH1-like glycoside hydrolase domain-containing protein n=1 Tax=Cohnella fermenti TaxID=2565925 RepID=A0A4S4BTK8_9BACL|nr:hypothetical protein [Cohnella fermenti]THF78406.1 hypothetical protein E6C55_14445 [Cohnella fermenti]
MKHLENTHDLRLPEWGPYTKKYIGISHIADRKRGIRFDLSVMPGLYRRNTEVPNVTWESGYHPWEAAPDLTYYSFRHELEWKDKLYADISYSRLTDSSRLIRCEFVNSTELSQNVILHYLSSIQYPQIGSHKENLTFAEAKLPDGAVWIDALDYVSMSFAKPRPTDGLVYDGWYRGEAREHHSVGGSVLGRGFGADRGDQAVYAAELERDYSDAALTVRYRAERGTCPGFKLSGVIEMQLELAGTGEMESATVRLGRLEAGSHRLSMESIGQGEIALDGLVISESRLAGEIVFEDLTRNPEPEQIEGPRQGSVIYKFEDSPAYYAIVWTHPQFVLREYVSAELDMTMRHNVHHHTEKVLRGKGEGHFSDIYLRPIPIEPMSSRTVYAAVCSGTLEEARAFIEDWDASPDACEEACLRALENTYMPSVHPEGETYRFSQRIMQSTLLLNVVYPVYTQRQYIRHYTPGRWWDSLYTWDAGFIGLGLAEIDRERAIDCLNAYVTEPGNAHAAFIHHGSPVPVQHYLFLELWNQGGSEELLQHFYPRLRQYYLFQSGQTPGSTMATMKSGLLKSWDYFYNSGGWDDYPPQVHVHENGMEDRVTPVSVTAHAIRIAKILRMAALALGDKEDDAAGYERDIRNMSESIHRYAWDEQSGYYGYVVHDSEGQPAGLLKHESGDNLNRGFDGVYPLVAGIEDEDRSLVLLEKLFDKARLWSPIGLTAVDQSAAYYRNDGYWNGAVWMAHQWFFWKTMLDLGRPNEAYRIADTALRLWKREAEATYHSLEHFIVDSGRGAGWHQFGALSAPVLNWFSAYYRPGRATWGFDVWVRSGAFSADHSQFQAAFDYHGEAGQTYAALVCMNPNYRYQAQLDGEAIPFQTRSNGVLELALPTRVRRGELHIAAIVE